MGKKGKNKGKAGVVTTSAEKTEEIKQEETAAELAELPVEEVKAEEPEETLQELDMANIIEHNDADEGHAKSEKSQPTGENQSEPVVVEENKPEEPAVEEKIAETVVEEKVEEPVAEVKEEQVVEPVAEPVAEVKEDPVAEPVVESVAEAVAETVAEVKEEPVAEVKEEPVAEPVAEPVVEQIAEPAAEPVAEPIKEEKAQPEAPIEAESQQLFASGNEESSGFQVIKQEQESKVAPVQIEQNHVEEAKRLSLSVSEVGIKNVERNIQPEIQSPFRRRKTQLGLGIKIQLKQSDDKEIQEEGTPAMDFSQLEQIWGGVQSNTLEIKQRFEDIKKETNDQLTNMYNVGDLQGLAKCWEQQLDIGFIYNKEFPRSEIDTKTHEAFNDAHRSELKEIEQLVHLFSDWISEKLEEIKEIVEAQSEQNKKEDMKKKQALAEAEFEQKRIEAEKREAAAKKNAEAAAAAQKNEAAGERKFNAALHENDVIVQAELLGVSSRDHEDLKIQVAKKQDSMRLSQKSDAEVTEKKENKDDEGSSIGPWVLIAASVVAAGFFVYKKIQTK